MNREEYYQIRKRKDERYENTFYIGVWSRGVFCRVTCPDHMPKDKNDLVYFHNIYEAMEAGLLPCKDCEPDMHSEQVRLNVELSNEVNNAVDLINEGYLNANTIDEMAGSLFISERHLRRLFEKEVGISPTKIANYQKLFFAKKLLYNTNMLVTDIAFASGFNSVRQFNYMFKKIFKIAPNQLRKNHNKGVASDNILYLIYHEEFDFEDALKQLQESIIPGIERIEQGRYVRNFMVNDIKGYFVVEDCPGEQKLKLRIEAKDNRCYMAVYHKLQRMFGLVNKYQKTVLGFNPYEVAIREILCDAYGINKARRIEESIVWAGGIRYPVEAEGLKYVYPGAEQMGEKQLYLLPIERNEKKVILKFNEALNNNKVTLAYNQSYDNFRDNMLEIEGISLPVVERIAAYGLGMNLEVK